MNTLLSIKTRNNVLRTMASLLDREKEAIISLNKKDLKAYKGDDISMFDRLKVDEAKVHEMIAACLHLATQEDPVGLERFSFRHDNGMQVYNKTASFGTILIIYESRPDVTVEAAGIAFKSGNKILLKGGKESLQSNLKVPEKVELFKSLSDQFLLLSHQIDKYEENEITRDILSNLTDKYDGLVQQVNFSEIPRKYKIEVITLWDKEQKSLPLNLNGVSGIRIKKRFSNDKLVGVVGHAGEIC